PEAELRAGEPLPYRVRDDFLSPAELSFYGVLRQAVGASYAICPKANLADVLFVAQPHLNHAYRNKIDRKHVDSLLGHPGVPRPERGAAVLRLRELPALPPDARGRVAVASPRLAGSDSP